MSKSKKRLVPVRRFKEFENADTWEQRKLSDFSKTTYGGGTPKTAVTEYWDGNIPWIQSSNLTVDDVQEVNLDKFITDDAIKNSAAKLIPANSIAIVTRVGVGKLTLMKQEFATSQDFLSLSELHVDEQFGLYSIYKLLQKELNNIQGTSIKGMTKADLLTKDIMIPVEKDEQIKIGSFFKQLDHLITLHQRKLDKLKRVKSAYLTEMFPAEGEREPKRRFPGFTGAWEQRKLRDIAEINPKSVIPKHFRYVDLESVVGTRLISFKVTEKNHAPSRAQRLAQTGDIFYQTVRPYQKNNYLFEREDTDYVFSTGYAQIRSNIDNHFLVSYLQTPNFVRTVLEHSTGTSYPAISPNSLSKISIYVPPIYKEQYKIGSLFSRIDILITLHQRKLDKLKKMKAAYINEMFV